MPHIATATDCTPGTAARRRDGPFVQRGYAAGGTSLSRGSMVTDSRCSRSNPSSTCKQVLKAANDKAGGGDEHQRERDLRDDQDACRSAREPADGAARARFERADDIDPRRLTRRDDAEDQD